VSDSGVNLESELSWQAMLGYLNFSEGRTDTRFQSQLNLAFRTMVERGASDPVAALAEALQLQLAGLRESGASAFQQVQQAEAVLGLVFAQVLPAYRQHHVDVLGHQGDRDLFQPFFLARVFEAVLAQGPPWSEGKRIVAGALSRLNDYVGHRPIALLESRPRGEPYEHERVRPVPLYIRGAGVADGRYSALVSRALEVLAAADAGVRQEACFDLKLLDEFAFDPRAYDHGYPANRRPNYLFGEWDPHHMDSQGRFRRFVVRQHVLEALLDRVEHPGERNPDELLQEAAAVLAGVVLMASGISGSTATTHDSSVTLKALVQRISQYRDAFYDHLLKTIVGAHGDRLRQEATALRQPFGGARQHLNQYIAQHRAVQQQERHLALLFAEMGHPEASREHAARISTPSLRLLSEVLIRLSQGHLLVEKGQLSEAAARLPEAEDLLQRGIQCGAFADPWNILGFQGLFPLFQSREDSIHDPRIDELIDVVERLLALQANLLGEAAALGDAALGQQLKKRMRGFAAWWDQFASVTVSGVRRVHGGEAADAAERTAVALARWHEQGEASTGVGFWKQHLRSFHSPKAFALVVDALLRKGDFRASMALLMNWLGQAEQAPLEDGDFSFHALTMRWMAAVTTVATEPAGLLVEKFFDLLEANADDNWEVPSLDSSADEDDDEDDEEENPYQAAYDDVTYKDSTDDGQEGALIEDAPPGRTFDLEEDARRLEKRLRFLSTVARLWEIAARQLPGDQMPGEALPGWLRRGRANLRELLSLLDAIHERPIPQPVGTDESLMEYDRRRLLKEQLLEGAIGTCLDTVLAVRALSRAEPEEGAGSPPPRTAIPEWAPAAVRLEQAVLGGDVPAVLAQLPAFLRQFQSEPLLFVPLSAGGHPAAILKARIAQAVLQTLVEQFPRLGMLRETYHLMRTARAMEEGQSTKGRRVTEFNRLFQIGFQGVIETVVASAQTWEGPATTDRGLVELLERLTAPFLRLWIDHSRSLQISSLEKVSASEAWEELRGFVQRYGRDLFTGNFLRLANLRGVLHRGTGAYLDDLRANPDPLSPVRLVDDLDQAIPRDDAAKLLKRVVRALVENYSEYLEFNNSTTQSDYGDQLHVLLEFLRLKASYDRHAWQFQPLVLVHEVLARHDRGGAAFLWQEAFTRLTKNLADQHAAELARLEQAHAIKLRTIGDRVQERFVKPLALDRLCVLVAPAMAEAQQPNGGKALARFRKELQTQTETPTGAGLEVPHWLRRLHHEVQRVRSEQGGAAGLTQGRFLVERRTLPLAEVFQQLSEWDKRAEGES